MQMPNNLSFWLSNFRLNEQDQNYYIFYWVTTDLKELAADKDAFRVANNISFGHQQRKASVELKPL
jgi:hypothetical protein